MKNKLSIYLAKRGVTQDHLLIDLERMKCPITLDIDETESVIYIHQPKEAKHPDWVDFIIYGQDNLHYEEFSKCQSESAIIVSRFSGYIFLLSFGGGHHKIVKDNIERDFGLRVTLNSVDPEKLRSLDKSNYQDNPLNTRNQSTKEVDILSLNIDSEIEILSTLTGKSNTEIFGENVTGKDSLTIATPEKLSSLKKILSEALIKYKQPLPKNFEWIDNINKVKDKDLCAVLDSELDDLFKDEKRHSEFWLGEPEIVDWSNQIGYVFGKFHSRCDIHPTLTINNLKTHLFKHKINLDCNSLRNLKIHIIRSDETSYDCWTAYSCLYAEVETNGEIYILRNNTWYLVKTDFVRRVDNELSAIESYDFQLPIYKHNREDEYNEYIAANDSSLFNLDKKLIYHGGNKSKFEFADIIRNNYDFIHVKYYRSSSTLSHLFAQGFVALELFVSDQKFREKLNKALPPDSQLADIIKRPETSKYNIIYAIAINRDIPIKLPLFSKITLKNTVKSLNNLGFTVKLAKIEIDPILEKTKKNRSK